MWHLAVKHLTAYTVAVAGADMDSRSRSSMDEEKAPKKAVDSYFMLSDVQLKEALYFTHPEVERRIVVDMVNRLEREPARGNA